MHPGASISKYIFPKCIIASIVWIYPTEAFQIQICLKFQQQKKSMQQKKLNTLAKTSVPSCAATEDNSLSLSKTSFDIVDFKNPASIPPCANLFQRDKKWPDAAKQAAGITMLHLISQTRSGSDLFLRGLLIKRPLQTI